MKKQLFHLLDQYCACKLVQVENILEGNDMMIIDPELSDLQEEIYVYTNVGKYRITKVIKSEVSEEDLRNCYSHYVVAEFNRGRKWILQSLNYEKLNGSTHSLKEGVYWKFYELEVRIKNAIDDLIKNSVTQENINIKGILSLVLKEISDAAEMISSNIKENKGDYKYPIYSGQNSRRFITETMQLVAEMQRKFIDDLKNRYQDFISRLPEGRQLDENKEPSIFANDFGYTLFMKLHELYKDHKAEEANYSFIWYALEKNGLLICKHKEYLEYISSLDIHISKINSAQKNEGNRKWEVFKSIKESFEA